MGLSGCALTRSTSQSASASPPSAASLVSITPFSDPAEAGVLPAPWEPYIVTRNKRPTEYRQVPDTDGIPVIEARVDNSASGFAQKLDIPVIAGSKLSWRWRADAMPVDADIRTRRGDDAPVRIALAFDGDSDKLSGKDHLHRELARLVSGRDMPYATLMYVWGSSDMKRDEVIPSPYTGRIRAIAVERGDVHLGTWQTYVRDIAADYERAFGEPPGRLVGIAIMSDGDNTQSRFTAWYGDIRLIKGDEIRTQTAAN
ncbi:hypothetical protein PTE30175_04556 [Pandoraea terrae]|uniref:DUF3047 domain-containing protein n=2 Tax=Pandoraea terrae TaxID=1537710 RepID=A0A5E4YQG9_9BURK|nr:hypothetical protein PTE30175_04556 [Pandoraea terrae]